MPSDEKLLDTLKIAGGHNFLKVVALVTCRGIGYVVGRPSQPSHSAMGFEGRWSSFPLAPLLILRWNGD